MNVQASASILRIKNPSRKQFLEMWKEYQPFLIEDVAEHWNACKNWSNDYLIKHCGNNMLVLHTYQKNFSDDCKNFACEDTNLEKELKYKEYIEYFDKEMKYKEYIEYVANQNNNDSDLLYYLTQRPLEENFPEIVGDVTYPEYLNRKPLVHYWHGLSSKKFCSTSVLHFDAVHNIFVQIRGRKKILLYPPSNYLSFYPPLEDHRSLGEFSKVNPNLLNLELYPKFPWQERMEVVLQPGEILYIPPFWWHHVTAVDENISLSFWYDIKIQDFFKLKNMLSVFLNFAPHYYLYRAMCYQYGLKNLIAIIKSLISR